MPVFFRVIIISVILFLIDLYFYQAVSTVIRDFSVSKKNLINYIYWSFTVFTLFIVFSFLFIQPSDLPKFVRLYVFALALIVLVSKIIGVLFIGIDDLIRFFRWAYSLVISNSEKMAENVNAAGISRLKFLNQFAVGFAAIPFVGLIYGMVKGGFNYTIHKSKVVLPNLPAAFNGLRIVQISDIHSGSFLSISPFEKAVNLINEQKPDIVFFTGDLVNDKAEEMQPFMNVFNKITAPMGVYSTLGNHDYGDYVKWETADEKENNLNELKNIHQQLGWKLLLNEHTVLKKNDAEIALIGVENWGGNLHFTKYGDMAKAYKGAEKYPVKILLSHDPSHWSMQVTEHYNDVDLTLSGHTHGFQFGIEIPGFKWSPSQYVYKQWAGLYQKNNQYLYVNRGLGFLGYPGRVGISPEITVLELYNA
jgi:predicted MPP superfamily phosphohydrolase